MSSSNNTRESEEAVATAVAVAAEDSSTTKQAEDDADDAEVHEEEVVPAAAAASVSYTAYGGGAGGPPPSFSDPSLPAAVSASAPAATTPSKAPQPPQSATANANANATTQPFSASSPPWKLGSGGPPGSPWGTDRNGMPPPYPPPPPGYPAFAGHPPQYWGPRPPIPLPGNHHHQHPHHHHLHPHAHHPGHAHPSHHVPSGTPRSVKLPTSGTTTPGTTPDRRGATSPSEIEENQRRDVQHMGCTCKKTRCLKLYCQCFAVQIDCQPNICRCLDCHNSAAHDGVRTQARQAILQRNPQAFATKFQKDENVANNGNNGAELAHKLGCKCRKSGCVKKYCECFAGNVFCNDHCRCVGCKNRDSGAATAAGFGESSGADPTRAGYYAPFPSPMQVMRPMGRGPAGGGAADAAAAAQGSSSNPAAAKPPTAQPYTAAQNLTYLKHAPSPGGGDDNYRKRARMDGPEVNAEAMDSLMMAAYAMTEFGQGSSPSKARVQRKPAPANTDAVPVEHTEI